MRSFIASFASVVMFVSVFSTVLNGQTELYRFDGDSADDQFGFSVSNAGDVNGDGFDDVIVGARNDDNNGENSGSARVFSGRDGSELFTFYGDSTEDFFGSAVSNAGDVNGDGFDDVIVGAPGDDNRGGFSGSARVFSGQDGSILFTLNGNSAGDLFGFSVSTAGDVNNDGFDDVIVGAYLDDNSGHFSGSARVFSGQDGSVMYTFNGEEGDRLGNSVSTAGDVNNDGFDDVIIGIYRHDDNGEDSGSAKIFSGADGTTLFTLRGDSAGDWFGWSVSNAGDVNNDGVDDIIVGTYRDDDFGQDSGSARVFSGQNGSVLFTFFGDSAGDQFGYSVSTAGDVNNDGFDDIIVGAYRDDDFGEDSGSARVFSGIDGAEIFTFHGDSAGDWFGRSVSSARDVDNDGFDDVIVGAYRDASSGQASGSAYVYSLAGLAPNCDILSFTEDENGNGLSDKDECLLGLNPSDRDEDSIPDHFEDNGFFFIIDGVASHVDMQQEYGVDPNRKDVLVHVDWMVSDEDGGHSHGPTTFDPATDLLVAKIEEVKQAFDNEGINLHVLYGTAIPETSDITTLGEVETGNRCMYVQRKPAGSSKRYFYELKREYFIANFPERARFFHYCILAHSLPEFTCAPTVPSHPAHLAGGCSPTRYQGNPSGISLGVGDPAMDFIVCPGLPGDGRPNSRYYQSVGGTFMHELGHNLGLDHGGVKVDPSNPRGFSADKTKDKPNHFSVMNYLYGDGLYLPGHRLKYNYSRGEDEIMPLSELNVRERDGIQATNGVPPFAFIEVCPPNSRNSLFRPVGQGIDWNCDGDERDTFAEFDLNGDCYISEVPFTTLNEWDHLVFDGGGELAQFRFLPPVPVSIDFTGIEEPTVEEVEERQNLEFPFRRGDANNSGNLDLSDSVYMLGCLFLGTECGFCPDASDVNDDGALDLSDPVYLLQWLFLGGQNIPSPHGECGADTTPDDLFSCQTFCE